MLKKLFGNVVHIGGHGPRCFDMLSTRRCCSSTRFCSENVGRVTNMAFGTWHLIPTRGYLKHCFSGTWYRNFGRVRRDICLSFAKSSQLRLTLLSSSSIRRNNKGAGVRLRCGARISSTCHQLERCASNTACKEFHTMCLDTLF